MLWTRPFEVLSGNTSSKCIFAEEMASTACVVERIGISKYGTSFAVGCPAHSPFFHGVKLCTALRVDLAVSHRVSMTATLPPKAKCDYYDLYDELIPYKDAQSWQKHMVETKHALLEADKDECDSVVLLQHPPVYTLGTRSSEKFLLFDLHDSPIDIYRTERGGEVTYHGPGQLVMYPIINLRHYKMDLHWYLRALEEVVIRALWSTFALTGSRIDGLTGVWVGNQKVAAIGVRVSRWITYHGLALNVTTDLTPFTRIVPCGISDRPVGTLSKILNDSNSMQNVTIPRFKDCTETWDACTLLDVTHKSLLKEFSEVFHVDLVQKGVGEFKRISTLPES